MSMMSWATWHNCISESVSKNYSPFLLRTIRKFGTIHPYITDIPPIPTKLFASSLIRTGKEWNTLPESVFAKMYNLGTFKARVNRYFLRYIRWYCGLACHLPKVNFLKNNPIMNKLYAKSFFIIWQTFL